MVKINLEELGMKPLVIAQAKFIGQEESDDDWCNCEAEGETAGFGTYYVDDEYNAAGKRISKHHYRCNGCHGITQIG